jgi:hypothetical protein
VGRVFGCGLGKAFDARATSPALHHGTVHAPGGTPEELG